MFRLFAFLACMCVGFAGCRKADNSLRIGMELTYPPFETQDASGNPAGLGVDLAHALGAELGRPVKIVPMEFSGLMPALNSGSIDLVLSSMTANDKRRESIDFSDPYAFTALALLVRKESDIRSVEDLKTAGRRMVVKSATTGESWTRANLPEAKLTAFTEETACVQEVAQGRADAFIYDQLSIYRYQKNNAATTRALLDPIVEESWGIGIAKGNDALKGQVNAFLEKFRKEGGFEKLGDRYLAEEKAYLKSRGIPFILH